MRAGDDGTEPVEDTKREPSGVRMALVSIARVRWVVLTALFGLVLMFVSDGEPAFLAASIFGLLFVAAATVTPREARPPRRVQPVSSSLLVAHSALVEALADPALVLRRSGRVASVNRAARQVFPSAKPDVPISFVIRAPEVLEALDRVRQSGRRETVRFEGRGGREKAYDVTLSLLPQRGGEPVIVVQLRDITEAQRIERMRTDFVANASHELRTPLASVLGFIETLQGPAKNDAKARERFLGIMAQQAQRMSRLIDDLLSLSKIEERAHVRPRDSVDVWQIASQVADGLAPLAKELGVVVSLVEGTTSTTVRGDHDELTRVLENLIENAIKYGRDGERVTVTTEHDGTNLFVRVRDYGPGIAPEDLPRLTERFYRVDVAGSRAMGGTGLGLALAKNILLRHGGRLLIASQVGHGATFTAELPTIET